MMKKLIRLTVITCLTTLIYGISVYGFETRMTFKYKFDPYILDLNMADSTYRYCKIGYSDSTLVIGKEVTHGRIDFTDSTLVVFSPDAVYPQILLMSSKRKQKGSTNVILENYGNFIEEIILYSAEMTDSIEYIPDSLYKIDPNTTLARGASISGAKIPMNVENLKIIYGSHPQTAIISLKDLPHKTTTVHRSGAEIHNLAKNDFDCIWVRLRTYVPKTARYFWAGEDSLIYKVPVFGSATDTRNVTHYVREHRRVLIYRDDTTLPYNQ